MMIFDIIGGIIMIILLFMSIIFGMAYQRTVDMTDRDELGTFEKKFDNFICTINHYIEW